MEISNLPVAAPQNNAIIEIEKSRAVQEVQAAMVVAKNFPRDEMTSYTKIMRACERPSMAKSAMYRFKRGDGFVSGASVYLAKMMARNFGNMKIGIREISRVSATPQAPGRSMCESFCHDLENNFEVVKSFEVAHVRDTSKGPVRLTSERDIYEMVANYGARRLRAAILDVIPKDFEEDALERCRKVQAIGDKSDPIEARIRRVVLGFSVFGVTQEMLEKHLGHAIDLTTVDELVDLQGIYNSLQDKTANRSDFFVVDSKSKPKEQPVIEAAQEVLESDLTGARGLQSKLAKVREMEATVAPG